jgi:hypothetical protein
MTRSRFLSVAVALGLLGTSSCEGITEPDSLTDIATARARWLAGRPHDYVFEVAFNCFCIPRPLRIRVAKDTVFAAENLNTGEVVPDITFTLETLWDEILRAQASADYLDAKFDHRGVPISAAIDWNRGIADEEIYYVISGFRETR